MDPELAAQLAALATRPIIPAHGMTEALHLGMDDLPWIDPGNNSEVQLLHVDLVQGLWISRVRMQPGCEVVPHYHTGSVFAVTLQGSWYYKEYPEHVNRPGSYLFEPAGSRHTLMVPAEQKEPTIAWFAIYGANINLDAEGKVTSVVDAFAMLEGYRLLCRMQGVSADKVIVVGEPPAMRSAA
jgi:2,4'-dihydroxyacetophenone dioxygenase